MEFIASGSNMNLHREIDVGYINRLCDEIVDDANLVRAGVQGKHYNHYENKTRIKCAIDAIVENLGRIKEYIEK